ncbi:MAG: hypothetical protein UFJ02_05775, partial [Prevotella sp.]|nr:hypothetical protein [Prevotella sp.]
SLASLSLLAETRERVSTGWGLLLFACPSLLAETQECVSTGWGFFLFLFAPCLLRRGTPRLYRAGVELDSQSLVL